MRVIDRNDRQERVERVRARLLNSGKPAHVEKVPFDRDGPIVYYVYDVVVGDEQVGCYYSEDTARAVARTINERKERHAGVHR
jgi:hypothetical protein